MHAGPSRQAHAPTGDLHAAICQAGSGRGSLPEALPDVLGLRDERGHPALVNLPLAHVSPGQQLLPALIEAPLQGRNELLGLERENPLRLLLAHWA